MHRLGLLVGEWLRISDYQLKLAISQLDVLLQQLPDPLAIVRHRRHVAEQFFREIELQGNFVFQVSKNVLRPLGQGVQAIFRHIETHAPEQHSRRQVDHDQQYRHYKQTGSGKKFLSFQHCPLPVIILAPAYFCHLLPLSLQERHTFSPLPPGEGWGEGIR